MILQQLVNGLTLGSIYALIALGYTLVYGILLMINFAHSEIFMIGAYVSLWSLSFPWLRSFPAPIQICLSIFMAMLGSGLLGFFIERVAYKPLRNSSKLAPLISAIGISIFLQNFIFLFVSNQSIPFPQIFPLKHIKLFDSEIN